MSDHCIIKADFADFRRVKGRKVLQLYMEIPLEESERTLNILGHPKVGESTWVAIALLKPEAEGQAPEGGGSPKSSKPFSSLPLSQQAAIRCGDQSFRNFIAQLKGLSGDPYEGEVEQYVRYLCGVESRKELDKGVCTPCRDAWLDLEAKYQTWLTDQKYAGSRR